MIIPKINNTSTIRFKTLNSKNIKSACKENQTNNISFGSVYSRGLRSIFLGGIMHEKQQSGTNNFPAHIDFTNAKNVKEAVQFGKTTFGIKKYKGFSKDDLEILNWINEGMTRVNNYFEGKAAMPNIIEYDNEVFNNEEASAYMREDGTLCICKKTTARIKKITEILLNEVFESQKAEEIIDTLKKGNNFSLWYYMPQKIMSDYPQSSKKYVSDTYISPFSLISHEMGHLEHAHYIGTSPSCIDDNAHYALLEKMDDVENRISFYVTTSPTEFVAEVFAKLVDGVPIDNDIMELYKDFGGPVPR